MDKARPQLKAENDIPPEFELEDDGPEIVLDSRTTHLCNLVFNIELLRETIIDFVVHDHNDIQGVSKKNAFSCRLVQKSWTESVLRCLVKSGNSLVEVGCSRSIESFYKIYDPSSPLAFKFTTGYITEDVARDLEKCLYFCNNGLVELELNWLHSEHFFLEGKPLKRILQQKISLPNLRKLKYCVDWQSMLRNTDKENNGIDIRSLQQLILTGSCNLKYFEFSFTAYRKYLNNMIVPLPAAAVSLGNLLLPGTTKNLKLDCLVGTHHLEVFLKMNMLSNLTDLTLVVPDVVYGDSEWLSRILNHVRYTLKNLTINGGDLFRGEKEITTIDPPVMKCLKRIFIRTANFEWADGITDLHQKLPALEKLDLQQVRSCILKKWVDNSKFDLLTDLGIRFYDFGPPPERSFLTIDNAQLMSQAFVKVTKLKISTPFVDKTDKALQCLFQNMPQLQVLSMELIAFKGYVVPPRYLDALLLGISCELIDTLRSACAPGKLWETVQLNVDEQYSVVNLSQLKEITLQNGDELFVSEKVEAFVVSKMPNLHKIELPRPKEFSKESGPDAPNPNSLPPSSEDEENYIRRLTESGRIYNWEEILPAGPDNLTLQLQLSSL